MLLLKPSCETHIKDCMVIKKDLRHDCELQIDLLLKLSALETSTDETTLCSQTILVDEV